MMNLTALAFYKNPPPKREPPPTPSFPLPHSVIPAPPLRHSRERGNLNLHPPTKPLTAIQHSPHPSVPH